MNQRNCFARGGYRLGLPFSALPCRFRGALLEAQSLAERRT